MRNCSQCGAQVSEIAKFCEQCGTKLEETKSRPTEDSNQNICEPSTSTNKELEPSEAGKKNDHGIEELDLTALDKEAIEQPKTGSENQPQGVDTTEGEEIKPKQDGNIINLADVLESEEKVEADGSIKREVLADDEVFSKVCPMCGEELQINKQLLENAPVMVKCLKCGNETKIW